MDGSKSLSPELLLAHAGWVKRLSARIVLDATNAEDVEQQAWLAAIESPPRDAKNLRGWFAAVLRRVARRMRIGESRRREREREAAAREAVPPTDELVARARVQRAVVDAVLALDEPYRGAVLLRFFEDLPPREIAARLDVPVETVRTRLKRASALLRERLEREVDLPTPDGALRSALGALVFMLGQSPPVPTALRPDLVASATTASVAGGLLMSSTAKTAVAALVVVVVAGTIPLATRSSDGDSTTSLASAVGPEVEEPTPTTPAPEVPALVDAARTEALPSSDPGTDVDRSALPSRRIVGTVRDSDGRAVADAFVAIEKSPGGNFTSPNALADSAHALVDETLRDLRQRSGKWSCVRTGSDGRFELVAPDARTVNVGALHPELGLVTRPGLTLDPAVSETLVELVLVPGLILTGRVTDEGGEPIAGASLMILGPSGSLADVKCDAEGRYRTLPLPERKLRVGAFQEGYVGNTGVDVVAEITARIHELDFRLTRAEYLHGRVLGPDGKPLSVQHSRLRQRKTVVELEVVGCKHDPRDRSVDWHDGSFRGVVAADGTWTLQLTGNELHWVGVLHADRVFDVHPIVEGSPGPDLVFDPSSVLASVRRGGLELHVRDEHGEAVLGYAVKLRPIDPTLPAGVMTTWNDGLAVDGAGVWRARDLLAGSWWVDVSKEGFVPASIEATIGAGGAEDATTRLDLALLPPQHTVRGRVVDRRAEAVPAAEVLVVLAESGAFRYLDAAAATVTDADGRFELRGLPDAELAIVVRPARSSRGTPGPRLAPAAIELDPASTTEELEVRLDDATTVRIRPDAGRPDVHGPYAFRVRNEAGLPLRDDTGPIRWSNGFASDGFEFFLAPGRYSLDVMSVAIVPKTVELTVTNAAWGSIERIEVTPRD